MWTLDRGPANYARGGANIAAPADPVAVYLNPSALPMLEGLQLSLDANMVFDNRSFTRASDQLGGPERSYATSQNEQPALPPSPGIFAAYNLGILGVEEMTIGLGIYGPPRVDRVWPAESGREEGGDRRYLAGQRYNEVESHNLQVHYALGAGYQLPWYGIRLGVTGMLIDQIIDTRLVLNAPIIEDPSNAENVDYDIDVQVDAKDSLIPSGIFAISAAPLEWLTLAVSYQHSYEVEADGTVDLELSEFYAANAQVEGDRVKVLLQMPKVLRAAVRYDDPGQLFDVELAYVWEGWGSQKEILFRPQNIQFRSSLSPDPIVLEDVVLPSGLRDTYSFRLGGSMRVIPDSLRIRLGGFYERAAVAKSRLSPSAFDLDKLGGTLGARVDLPFGTWIDLAGGYVHWLSAEVTDSEVRLQNSLTGDQKHPIGNGTYENSQIWLMAGLGVRLDI